MATYNFNSEKKSVRDLISQLVGGFDFDKSGFNSTLLDSVPTHFVNRKPEPFNKVAVYFYFDLPFGSNVPQTKRDSTFADDDHLLKSNTFENPLAFELPKGNWYLPVLAYCG